MASDVAGAKAAIYSRLADAPTFHPANASLFEDWTLQGGDVITVTSDSDSYSLPIYGMRMRWNGGTRVTVESTGNEKRDAIEKMAQRETARASNGYRSGIKSTGAINHHAEMLAADGSILYQAGLRLNAQGVLVYAAEDDNNLQSKLNVTSRAIEQEVIDRQNEDFILSGRIAVEAGKITQIVTAVGADGQVTSASIVTAINNQTGEGIVRLDADKIILDGNTTLKGMMTIDSGNLQVNGNVYAGLNGSNYFQGNKLRLVGASSSQGAQVEELTASDISDMIIKAEVSGNELRLWKKGDSTTGSPSLTFSKATSQSSGWSGNAVLTVSATQGATTVNTYTVGFGTSYNSHSIDLELTTNGAASQYMGSIIAVPVKIQQLTGSQSSPTDRYTKDIYVACADLLETKTINANGTYTADTGKIGLSSVTVSIAPTLSGSWSSGTLTVSSSPAASSNLTRTLAQGTASWASDKKSVTVPVNATYGNSGQYSESTGWSVYVPTTTSYYAGSASVTLSNTMTWETTPSSSISANQNSVTISTSGRVNDSGTAAELTKTLNLYSQASTSGLTATFYVTHTDSTDAKRIIKRTATCSDANLVAANIKSGVSIFGVAGTYSDAVTISPSTSQTLDPGESITISALKNGVSIASVSVSANTDANLLSGNIKNGVTIFGVTGSYSGSSGTVVWPSPQTSYSYATFTANGESRTYTVVAPYTLNNANYAVLKRGDDVFAALNIQDSYNNVWTQAYISGWNAYYNQTWYIPTDSGSGGQFKIPSAADSSGAWSYINWTRATNAYNDAAGSHTDKGSNWYCTITTDSSGNKTCRLSRTFGVAQSVPFTNGQSYHLYT